MEMAHDSIGVYERYRLRFGLGRLSVFKIIRMGIQEIFVYLALGIALAYLFERFKKRPKKKDKNCGDDNCGC